MCFSDINENALFFLFSLFGTFIDLNKMTCSSQVLPTLLNFYSDGTYH